MEQIVRIAEPVKQFNIAFKKSKELKSPSRLFIKRSFDLICSSIFLLIPGLLVFPILAVLIKLSSEGPVFFFQKRTGKDGKVFQCIKFRTMVVNEFADLKAVEIDDKRITKIGLWMRRYYLDELPQLINVIRGEMSLVGPRPHMLVHDAAFEEIDSRYKLRQMVLPGITGLAQVKGLHGSIQNNNHLVSRIDADLDYIQNWSLSFDFKILLKTFLLFFKPNNKPFFG